METQNDSLYKIADLRQETEIDQEKIKNAVTQLLTNENPNEGLQRTPDRVSR
jgi:GTP cyclohydrolase I